MPAGSGGQGSTGGGASVSRGLGRKGPVIGAALVGTPGSRKAGEKVHFCVLCDLPIAIYGLLVSTVPSVPPAFVEKGELPGE